MDRGRETGIKEVGDGGRRGGGPGKRGRGYGNFGAGVIPKFVVFY